MSASSKLVCLMLKCSLKAQKSLLTIGHLSIQTPAKLQHRCIVMIAWKHEFMNDDALVFQVFYCPSSLSVGERDGTHISAFLASTATLFSQFTRCECVRRFGGRCEYIRRCKPIVSPLPPLTKSNMTDCILSPPSYARWYATLFQTIIENLKTWRSAFITKMMMCD